MNNIPPAIAQALSAFVPPDDALNDECHNRDSLVVPCPACDGGWHDTPTGTVMCGQCRGAGQVATNGGEV